MKPWLAQTTHLIFLYQIHLSPWSFLALMGWVGFELLEYVGMWWVGDSMELSSILVSWPPCLFFPTSIRIQAPILNFSWSIVLGGFVSCIAQSKNLHHTVKSCVYWLFDCYSPCTFIFVWHSWMIALFSLVCFVFKYGSLKSRKSKIIKEKNINSVKIQESTLAEEPWKHKDGRLNSGRCSQGTFYVSNMSQFSPF